MSFIEFHFEKACDSVNREDVKTYPALWGTSHVIVTPFKILRRHRLMDELEMLTGFISTTVTTIRVIMVVGVKDSDMEDSDAFAIEDTVEDYALCCERNANQTLASMEEHVLTSMEGSSVLAPLVTKEKRVTLTVALKETKRSFSNLPRVTAFKRVMCPHCFIFSAAIKHSLDNCLPNPCQNGGSCFSTHDGFKCLCSQGYKGKTCEAVEYCKSAPCLNGGTCKETFTGYSCICKSRFRGKNCDMENHCRPTNPCEHDGLCVEMDDGYKCRCKVGYKGVNCEAKEYCTPNPCKNSGTCTAQLEGYMCLCQLGFRGETCEVQDMCASNPCLHDGTCFEMDNNTFKCLCVGGWKGEHCHEKDFCIPNPCKNEGHCEAHGFSFQCHCTLGYKGKHCEGANPCFPNPCTYGGKCEQTKDSFMCNCPAGRVGELCEEIDPCFPNPCQNEGACYALSHGEYKCTCPQAFVGAICTVESKCIPNPCLHDGTCRDVDVARGYVCYCSITYLGPNCEKTNLCFPNNPCQNGGTCKTDGTNMACQCAPGYLGSHCEQLNFCHSSPCKMKEHALPRQMALNVIANKAFLVKHVKEKTLACQIRVNTMARACRLIIIVVITASVMPGGVDMPANEPIFAILQTLASMEEHVSTHWIPSFATVRCDTQEKHCGIDKCKRCDINANCVNGTCECKHGFVGNGFTCTPVGDPCRPNPCENGGTCNPGHGEKLFECACREGYTGVKCEVSKSACTSSPCVNGGTCIDATNNDGSLLEGVIFTDHSQYKCICPKGYAGENCQKLVMTNPCSAHPCLNNGTCIDDTNRAGMDLKLINALDFRCFCPIGYSGIICETPRSACHSSPCLHGGTCLDSSNTADVAFNANGYKCLCVEGFIGMNCQAGSASSLNPPPITASLQGTVKPTVHVIDVNASPGGPTAVPLVITPQVPKVSGLVGAGAEPQETTLPAKQVPIPVKPNVGLTAEVERPNPNQVGVVVIPQSAQLLPSGGTGRPPPPGPPAVVPLQHQLQVLQVNLAMSCRHHRHYYHMWLHQTWKHHPPVLLFLTRLQVPKAAAAPSAGLISSPPVMPSLLTGLASSPAIGTAQAPAIVMPPGLRPPPGNGPLTLALPVGAPHLRIPARRQLPYQRPANYQPDYAGYYGYKNTEPTGGHNPLSYRSSQYPQKQWYSNRFYPASSYPRRGVASANTFQRRYRQTDHKRSTNQDTDVKTTKDTSRDSVKVKKDTLKHLNE
ncbi:hypothetical protein OS493_007914 [Desmophyllum pertusum]|uniref:EGF-like domain-containing protein n=1 Tax=Desmophyllum pertusum TaxID=174260 RepID=A0A9X0CG79_9CNID|nr:hypothetical protein OS493_007914 [Desmophyllum pertusum]